MNAATRERGARVAGVGAVIWIALTIVTVIGVTGRAAQEETVAPLSVEAVGVEPTVAMTGDVLTATYRVRFQDLTGQGKEIVVIEDRMAPDKLPLAPFEGLGLEVEKHRIGADHIWEFRYRLRIVAPTKDVQTLRSLTFFYLIRDLGQKVEDARVLQTETAALEVRYVSTITGDPVLNIHDPVELGSFSNRITLLRGIAWVVAPLPLLLWTAGALRAARRPALAREIPVFEPRLDVAGPVTPPPTVMEARRALFQRLRAPAGSGGAPSGGREVIDFQRDVVIALREYLLAEIPSLNPGDTAREIRRHIETMAGPKRRTDVLKQLAARLVMYQTALERGESLAVSDVSADGPTIERLVSSLRWHSRVRRWTLERLGR